jgi:hypothetical protein
VAREKIRKLSEVKKKKKLGALSFRQLDTTATDICQKTLVNEGMGDRVEEFYGEG